MVKKQVVQVQTKNPLEKAWQPALLIVALLISLPIFIYGLFNKLLYGFWFFPVFQMQTLDNIANIESATYVQMQIDDFSRYVLEPHTWGDYTIQQTLQAHLNSSGNFLDSDAVLLEFLEKYKLRPTQQAVMSEQDVREVSRLLQEQQVLTSNVGRGSIFKLRGKNGEVVYAWDIHSAVAGSNEEFIDQIAFSKDNRVIELHSFGFDLEGSPLTFLVIIISEAILISVIIVKTRKISLKKVGIAGIVLSAAGTIFLSVVLLIVGVFLLSLLMWW